jgi:mono/diheme cytochrome c family protein
MTKINIMNFIKIIFLLLFFNNVSLAHNHFPITTDSSLMIKRGELVYNQNCVSCHMIDLSGAKKLERFR